TLWQGLCAEDGPQGVAVTPPFRRMQEFMLEQMHAGILLALCSKNHEADAMAVFERHADMILRREHLAGWRINWEPKPENLRSLAAQFNVSLDSFVFIDDNPVECAAVRANCPEVAVLQLPQDSGRIFTFLENVWLLDRTQSTREDRERSKWYQTNLEREELQSAAPTLRDFLDGLQLRIEVTEVTDEQLGRVAQLTTRTNQFNFTSIRRSEAEIRELLKSGMTCLVTSASDRFGDYGLVGVILYTATADRYLVDTFLLSCRALGKGVEHRMMAELAVRALCAGKPIIELSCVKTDRNEPAREFIGQLRQPESPSAGHSLTLELPASALAELRYTPEDRSAKSASGKFNSAKGDTRGRNSEFGRTNLSSALQRLGEEFNTVAAVITAIDSSTQPETARAERDPTDDSVLERALAAIWKKVLGRTCVGLNENFFDAGGTSLKAVVVVAAIRRELKKNASIVSIFECPTIKLLAARLDESKGSQGAPASATHAESRGRQRRNKLVKRRTT
ncbi:MAG: HAD-IIIC family phosphatase, partial [Chthoniobacteraceae bacterium]